MNRSAWNKIIIAMLIGVLVVTSSFSLPATQLTNSKAHNLSPNGSSGFYEDFSGTTLGPSWTVLSSLSPNHFSLTDRRGYLRYKLDAAPLWPSWPNYAVRSDGYPPSVVIFRSFEGRDWVLRMKVTHDFTQYSNGRQTPFFVVFKTGETGEYRKLTYLQIWRTADLLDRALVIEFVDEGVWVLAYVKEMSGLPNVLDTWYFEVTRHGRTISVLARLEEEQWFEPFSPVTMTSDADTQTIVIEGSSWYAVTNSYADYDYIYVYPAPSLWLTMGWTDTFEPYTCNAFPSPRWKLIFNGGDASQQFVDCSISRQGLKSLHLRGVAFSAVAARNVPLLANNIGLTAWVRIGSPRISSGLAAAVGFYWKPSPGRPNGEAVGRVSFTFDGKIRFDAASQTEIGLWSADAWIKVTIIIAKSANTALVWINDEFKGSFALNPDFVVHTQAVALWGEGGASSDVYFDAIRTFQP